MVIPGSEPISEDEIVYRRIPIIWYISESEVNRQAFSPNEDRDKTGISVSRAKYKSAEEAAKSQQDKKFYVAALRVSDLRSIGIRVEPRPLPDDPGHAELPDLNAANRKDDITKERVEILTNLCIEILGPF